MSVSAPAIQAVGLRKEYGSKVAVEDLTLTVEAGEVFGFLGPNGAGKTTSIKMLLGLAEPTAGEGWLFGEPIGKPESRRRVGFLPEHFRFHEWLRADEFLDLHARFFRIPTRERSRRVDELLALVGLSESRAQRLGTFSKGMLQRIGLAQALVNDPDLVFLDEPTSGLDPLGRRMVRDIIGRLSSKGTTVFLNSHLLSEVEVTCTRVAFITNGRVRRVTTLGQYEGALIECELEVGSLDDGLVDGLRQWSSRVDVDDRRRLLRLQLADRNVLPEIARFVVASGHALYRLAPRPVSLEDLFVSIVEGGDA